jgi:hypothetical protein
MAKCELLEKCRFFIEKMAQLPEAQERVKQYYCLNHHERCARFVFFKVTGESSKDLMPNEIEKVSERLGWSLESK